MNVALLLPMVVAVLAMGAAWFVPSIARPSVAVWAMTVSMVLAVVAIATLLLQVAAAGLSEIPIIADLIGWCRALYGGQHGATPIVGIVAFAILATMVWRVVRYSRSVRADSHNFDGVVGIRVVESDRPLAFAVPGNPGGVVISQTMIDELDRDECVVVLAHENAHLRYHHHAFVKLARACAAALPLLKPFARRVSFLTERWADEFAAERVGSRRLVADTIARVALLPATLTPSHAHGLAGGDVVRRFEALDSPATSPMRHAVALSIGIAAVASVGVVVQAHHLIDFLLHSA